MLILSLLIYIDIFTDVYTDKYAFISKKHSLFPFLTGWSFFTKKRNACKFF